MSDTAFINITHDIEGWVLTTSDSLTDDEAKSLTFKTDLSQAVLGEYIEVHDADGIRAGHIQSATLVRGPVGIDFATLTVELT